MNIISRIKGLPRKMEPAVEWWEEAGDADLRSAKRPYPVRFTLFVLTAVIPLTGAVVGTGMAIRDHLRASHT